MPAARLHDRRFYVLRDLGQGHELMAKIAAVGLAFTWNFLVRKVFVFKLTREEAAP